MNTEVESRSIVNSNIPAPLESCPCDEELARKLYEDELRFEASVVNDEALAKQIQEQYDSELAFGQQSKNPNNHNHNERPDQYEGDQGDRENGSENASQSKEKDLFGQPFFGLGSVFAQLKQRAQVIFQKVEEKGKQFLDSTRNEIIEFSKDMNELGYDIAQESHDFIASTRRYFGELLWCLEETDRVFGVSLEKACHGRDVPRIVDDCVALLSQRGVKEPNIFCSAICSSTQLNELRTLYNSGADVNIFEYDVSVVAELLLMYLRELPAPLLDVSLDMVPLSDDDEMSLSLQQLVETPLIAPVNYFVLKKLMKLLKEILAFSDENVVELDDLVRVFGPITLKPFGDERTLCVMRVLITHSERIFRDDFNKTPPSAHSNDSKNSNSFIFGQKE
jgi:hypothetical protein